MFAWPRKAVATAPGALIQAFTSRPTEVFDILTTGFTNAITQFGTALVDFNKENYLVKALASWMGVQNWQRFAPDGYISLENWQNLLLEYSGLTWDNVYKAVRERLGEGEPDRAPKGRGLVR